MSLLGKFYQIEKQQFFRRLHRDSSSWATNDEEHQARRYHASNVNRIPFSRFRFHWYQVEVVHRAPLSLAQRLDLYALPRAPRRLRVALAGERGAAGAAAGAAPVRDGVSSVRARRSEGDEVLPFPGGS